MGDLIAASSSLGINEQVYYIGVPPELDLKERKMGFRHSANEAQKQQSGITISTDKQSRLPRAT